MTKEEAIALLYNQKYPKKMEYNTWIRHTNEAIDMAIESLSAEPKWITDSKPTEDGEHMVTLDAFGLHRFIKLMDYGKPLLPNKEVRGKCWYDSDSEYGDVVYDDDEILAWMPLPKPYGESEVKE